MSISYDYIVVGSGSAGAVIAARLSEGGKYTVLCMEAGTATERYFWTRIPAGTAMTIVNPKVNWCRHAVASDALGGRSLYVPGGKIIGGTSTINGLIFSRGQRKDYDGWARLGCPGWSYQDVLPYFKKVESTDIGSDEYRGRSGPIKVTVAEKTAPFYDVFIQSAKAAGYPENPDYTGATQYGVAMAQQTIYRGRRVGAGTSYIAPARGRRNLTILTGAEATSLILQGDKCVGVRYRRGAAIQEVRATREVIVSAGAIGTPKLLELSGIGNPALLGKLGIPVVKSLPGVGENLQDHYGPTVKWTFKHEGLSPYKLGRGWRLVREVARYVLFRTGFLANTLATLRVFTRSHPQVDQADIALLVNAFHLEIVNEKRRVAPVNGFMVYAQVQRPESTGTVHIQSADPGAPPAVHFNFLATENDRRVAVAAVRRAREIAAAKPIADAIAAEILPGPSVQSDEDILEFIRTTGATTFHYVGTCKMGNDEMSVVDEKLRVRGIDGLRIADASIMPTIVSGNTSVPCMMIGERCAEMVLADAR
ncbi:MAG TPA: GMC family oxidoreductase N-terminal domain-containing protein [Ramlibacter sp.]|nr:GMC family oxidoreductase N-terminal domain-containing protein [Ramlibacter sp.]